MVAKLLRVANSVAYNAGRMVTDARRLSHGSGWRRRHQTHPRCYGPTLRLKDLVCFGELPKTLWLHTLRTAAAARAARLTRVRPRGRHDGGPEVYDLGAFYMLAVPHSTKSCASGPIRCATSLRRKMDIGESLMARSARSGISLRLRASTTSRARLKQGEPKMRPTGRRWLRAMIRRPPVIRWTIRMSALADDIEADYQVLLGALS
ncbi:MAG: hypothetical protein R3E34_11855 [Rhodocyclaceae bacterium]